MTYRPVIAISHQDNAPVWVSPGAEVPERFLEGHYVICGEQAHVLYIALTGHRMDEPPSYASIFFAQAARAQIEGTDDWLISKMVIYNDPLIIRPWFGVSLYCSRRQKRVFNPEAFFGLNLLDGGKVLFL